MTGPLEPEKIHVSLCHLSARVLLAVSETSWREFCFMGIIHTFPWIDFKMGI